MYTIKYFVVNVCNQIFCSKCIQSKINTKGYPQAISTDTALSSILSVCAITIFFFHFYSGKKVTSMFAAADEVGLFKFTFIDVKSCGVTN